MAKKKYFIAPILNIFNNEIFQSVSIELNNYLLNIIKVDFEYYYYKKNYSNNYFKEFSGLILCGGGDLKKIKNYKNNILRDQIELKLLNRFVQLNKKILSICRGTQLIASQNGSKIFEVKNHITNNHKINFIDKKKKINYLNVNSFHKYAFNKIDNFEILSKSEDQNIEIIQNIKKKILGVMFHPERKNRSQKKVNYIIKNFLL
jgi:gamma-glutamyl-gamma-aminobutyrate hydrolase PuuD